MRGLFQNWVPLAFPKKNFLKRQEMNLTLPEQEEAWGRAPGGQESCQFQPPETNARIPACHAALIDETKIITCKVSLSKQFLPIIMEQFTY